MDASRGLFVGADEALPEMPSVRVGEAAKLRGVWFRISDIRNVDGRGEIVLRMMKTSEAPREIPSLPDLGGPIKNRRERRAAAAERRRSQKR